MAKVIFITSERVRLTGSNSKTVYAGTIDELVNDVFGYTLECGNSWNSRVNRYPKTAKSLVSNLNKASEASCRYYQSNYYWISTPDEIAAYKAKNGDDMHSSCWL